MKTKKNFLKKLTAGILGFVMTLGVGAAGYAASASETKAGQTTVTINQSALGTSGTGTTQWMTDFSKNIDGATFYVHTMGTKGGTHAMQWNNKGYIYQTAAPSNVSYISSVSAVTNSKKITIYGSKTAFSDNSGGTSIGDITGTGSKTCTSTDGYKFIRVVGTTSSTQVTSITITYETASKSLSSIAVSENHRSFTVGDTFVKETVTATYSDSSTADVTNSATFSSPDMNTAGTKTISVSYTEGGTEKSTSYTISVTAPRTISSIEITSGFTKKTYKDNEDWDPAGLVVTAYYSSGTPASEVLNSDKYTLSYNPTKPNSTSIKSVFVTATLNADSSKTDELEITGITVTAAPLSITYDATKQGYANQQTIESWTSSPISIDFDQNTGNNPPKYYTSGTAVRAYAGNKITVSVSGNYNIVEITFTFGSDDGNTITASTGEFSSNVWTGESNSVAFTIGGSSGNRRVQAMEIKYAQGVVHYPVSVAASFATGKGTYFNGSINTSKLSFTDVVGTFTLDNGGTQPVTTIDKIEIFEGTTLKGTLTNSSDKYSFEGATVSNSWSLKITCNGVAQGGENLTSVALSITLNEVEASSYEWKSEATQPTTEFYSHFDTYNLGGTLYATYNDGSHATEGTSGHTRVDVIHEGSQTGTVIESIPSHTDGTINVTQNKTYWIESYFSQNADEGQHLFTQVTVNMPTMTVVNGDAAGTKYYTNVPFEPNPNITVMKGSTQVTGLDADDFDVSLSVGGQPVSNPYTPTTTDTITVKVSLAKDSGVYGSYTVTPVVSTKTLTSLVISNKTYTAGDLFTFGAQDILVNYIENEVPGSEYVTASSVTFTHSGETLNSSTRLLKNMNNWTINATYSIGEGEGKTVSTSFVITVSDKQISPYIPGTEADYFVKATSATELTSGKYLIVYESGNVALDGKLTADQVSNTISVTISNERIEKNTETLGAVVIYNSEDGSFLGTGGSYIGHSSGSGNTLDYSDEPLANSVSVNTDGNVVIDAGSSYVMRYNDTNGQKRFRYYKGTQQVIQLYQLATTADVGNKIDYLKSIVDAIRLNQQKYTQEDLKTELRAHSEWTKASGILAALTPTEWNSLNVADAFGPSGSTYKSVYELALALSVSFNGTHVSSNGASSCAPGAAYNATLTVDQGYQLAKENISITMGVSSFSDFSYENGSLQIAAGKVTGDLAISATATAITYTITYHLNDGIVETPNPASYNIETSATNLNPAIKTGYSFIGWYTKDGTGDDWGQQVTQIGGGATGNLSLYARYQIKNHSITFVGSNVTSSEGASSSCNYGEEYTAVFTAAANYNLPGAIDVKLDGVAYADYNYSSVTGNFSIPSMPDGDITITVVAQQGAYQISYAEANGTPINQPGLVTEYESDTGAHLEPASKLGYTFLGWYTENTFVHQVTDIQIGETGNKLFYAKWEFNSEDLDAINTQVGMSYKYTKDSNPIVSEGASTSKAETKTAPQGYKFEKATSIAVGDRVVLVSETANMEMTSISTTSTKYGVGTSYSSAGLTGDYLLTVEAGSDSGTFAFSNNSNYLRWNSGNSLDEAGTEVAKNTSWTVTFDQSGNALLANDNDSTREIWWNNGSPRFACYTGKTAGNSYYATQLYKLVPDKKEISSIAIVGSPTTTTYTVGQAYSTDGLSVQATYVDDTQGIISDATITINKATAAAGDTQIIYSCTYDGKTATDKAVNVTVNSVYSNGQFRFTFRPSGMDELVDTYLAAGYEDVGIMVSYNGKTRYFSYVDSYMYEGSEKTAYKLNEDGSFSLNLGDAIKNRSILDIEFTIKVYVKDANGYHTSSDSSAVVVSLSSWLQDHNKPAYQTDAFLELYHIFFPEA